MSPKGGKRSQLESVQLKINEHMTSVGEEILCVLDKQRGVDVCSVKLNVRVVVLERLSAVGEFMCNLFQREMETLETLLEKQNKLLDVMLQPHIRLNRADQCVACGVQSAQSCISPPDTTVSIKQEPEDHLKQEPEDHIDLIKRLLPLGPYQVPGPVSSAERERRVQPHQSSRYHPYFGDSDDTQYSQGSRQEHFAVEREDEPSESMLSAPASECAPQPAERAASQTSTAARGSIPARGRGRGKGGSSSSVHSGLSKSSVADPSVASGLGSASPTTTWIQHHCSSDAVPSCRK